MIKKYAGANDLKNGYVLDIEGELVSVVSFQHVKPGKGGAFVRTKLKNMTTGAVVDRTYPLEDVVEATRYVETGQKTGNVVLTVTDVEA